jgi:hypothetical protein
MLLAVQVLLDDVDCYASMPSAQREQEPRQERRMRIADTLRRLQRALDARETA